MNLKSFLKTLKLQESTLSMLFGVLVVLIVGFVIVRYFAQNRPNAPETLPVAQTENTEEAAAMHRVESGENLWTIAEKYYGTGYNWMDIRDANNLSNADQLTVGQEITIPQISPRLAQADPNAPTTPAEPEAPEAPSETENDEEEPTGTPEPTQAPEVAENPSNESGKHTVTIGESLWKIAQQYYNDGNKWVEIAQANNLESPSVISAGTTLDIPNAQTDTEKESQESDSYTVQNGDSLWSIAQGAYGDGNKWIEIAQANELEHPSVIHPGNTLKLPR